MYRLIFILLGVFTIIRLFMLDGIEAASGGLLLVSGLATMIWFPDFWASTLLRFGFWESKATDYKSSQNSSPAIAFLAWILLILFSLLVFTQ